MANLDFQLISDAKLGEWTIEVTVDGEMTTQQFKVDEYGELDEVVESWFLFLFLLFFAFSSCSPCCCVLVLVLVLLHKFYVCIMCMFCIGFHPGSPNAYYMLLV